jgi:hypothetical protein
MQSASIPKLTVAHMKKITALAAILFLLVISTHAQQPVLKGTISDTAAKQNLEHALITLLNAKDSTLYKFGRADKQGHFEIRNLTPGKYKAVITYAGYADYVEDILVQGNTSVDIGKINLITKAHLLEDVIVRQKAAAIRLKGDTIEYRADSFPVPPGASIEDMLRKVQGFTIDKDGKITANGIKIEKVLVDGEEFFGDDPTVATKNIDAAAVDKFQVYDKKSDQATFTGIDDGSATKTINFKLKEDRKRGLFGKLELGVGPDDKWNNSLMANAFRGKRRFSFFGIMSSTGKTGLGWDESSKYGGDNTQSFTADDGNTYIGGTYDDFESIYGSGLPKSWSAGINYGNKYNEDRQNLNGSYKYGKIITEGTGTTNTQSILPGVVLFNRQSSAGFTDKYRNSLNGTYDWMFDSSFSAKLTVRGYKGNTKKRSIFQSEQTNETNKINSSNRRSSTETNDEALTSSLIIRKKFKQPGQTISLSLDQRYTQANTDGYLFSLYDYYDKTGVNYKTDTTDQEKINGNLNKFISGKLAYTQPLSKAVTWEVSYGMGKTNTESKLLSYDNINGKYSSLNKQFSNSYAYDVATTTGGTMFRYNSKKTIIFAGGDLTRSDIKQQDIIKDSTAKYAYNNLFPRAGFTYKFSSNRRVNLNYNGNTRQPSITQIQPVSDNTNPNNIQVGNPALTQEFNHSVNLSYYDYKTMTDRGINISFYYTTTANAIRNSTVTDTANGKTTYKYINTNGNYNYTARFGFNRKFKDVWNISIDGSYSYRENVSTGYVNNLLSKTHSASHNFNIGFAKSQEKKFDVYIDLYATYNQSHSTIRPDVTNNYWTYNIYSYSTINFPKDIDLQQDIQAYFRQSTSIFSSNNNVVTWNISLSKKLFKDKKSEIRLKAYDILDQNKGVSRNSSTTTITETTFETLHRYYQLSFTWNFIKNPALAAK